MSFQRDYILRLIEQLREFLSQAVKLRHVKRYNEALMAIMLAQERLFGRACAQFETLSAAEQFRILTFGVDVGEAREKCLLQADLLSETARVYADREQTALAVGAWNYARELLELTAGKYPDVLVDERIAVVRREITLLQ